MQTKAFNIVAIKSSKIKNITEKFIFPNAQTKTENSQDIACMANDLLQ